MIGVSTAGANGASRKLGLDDLRVRWGPMLARPLHSAIVARKLAQRT
ncbi:MAG: hypothetical protein KC776_29245 [Myxococcales bacterium]|nr:hypothetical protein [Myxococcales bacterium]MCB9582489.1 hypothetical protein [Polyangiaceae bacterium]